MRRLAACCAALMFASACSPGLPVDEYDFDPAATKTCEALYADAPQTVAGQARRSVGDDRALAWGDNAITLRCGVPKPQGLTRSSRCDFVADVGWFTSKGSQSYTFTTIGREVFVSVEVPRSYDPAADILVDLAAVVVQHDPVVTPCV